MISYDGTLCPIEMIFSPISERILLGILVNEAKKLNNNESAVPFLADVAAGCLRDVSCFFI